MPADHVRGGKALLLMDNGRPHHAKIRQQSWRSSRSTPYDFDAFSMRLPRFPEPGNVLPGTAVHDAEGPRGRPRRLDGVADGGVPEGRIRTTAETMDRGCAQPGKVLRRAPERLNC